MTKGKNIALWVIQIALVVLFVLMSSQKLLATQDVVDNFQRWGMPDGMYYIIGTFELLGAIGLLIPRTAGMAAVGLILIMIGAVFTHLTHGEYLNSPLPLALFAIVLLVITAYFRKPLTIFGGASGEPVKS